MRNPPHPTRSQLHLESLLHSLSDPIRLAVVCELADHGEQPCSAFHDVGDITLPTLSHHLRVLREAGVTRTRIDGRQRFVSLRRDDLEARFPGVLEAVTAAARRATVAGGRLAVPR
jgi:DNA-binding transcriptional ArsR family regulator